ncbi:MAG TPA: hypothetical protein VMV79_03805, partial [Alphaproteobacteria bacterium]|nr:hypothetical protein [Alphaproteobacteria bacterium]
MTKIFVHATIIAAIVFVLAIVVPFILQWIDQASSVSISKKPEAAIALYTAFLALFTFALVIVSASQIYFLIRAERIANTTAQAAQKSAEVAKQTLIAADRAWIRIDRIEFANPGLFINNNGASGSVSFKITNIGKGPATNITLHAWLFAQKNGSPFAYEMQKQKCDEIRGQPLWAGFTLFPEDSFPNSIGISAWSSGVNINRIDMEE